MASLNQSTALYIEFWASIQSTNKNQEDVAKLNDLGTKINRVVEDIKKNFESMQKLKHNDELVIRLYSEFLLDILNEKEKGFYYKNRLNEIEGSNDDFQVQNDKNIDLDQLLSDEFQYIMISAENEKPNIIKKLTTGICSLFGYSKDELIGQPIDVLMPEQYHKLHRKILNIRIDEYKKFIANNLHSKSKKAFKSTYKEIFGMAKNKSKYLIPINIKASLITSADQSEIYFIGKIAKVMNNNNSLKGLLNISTNNFQGMNTVNNQALHQLNFVTTDSVCYILTDNNFIVQNFSANSIFLMGLKAKYNGNLDITRHVKELYEDIELNKIFDNAINNNLDILDYANNTIISNIYSNNNLNNISKELLNSLNLSKKAFFQLRYKNPVKTCWRFPAKLKEKVAFMANIISINEKKNNQISNNIKPQSRKNSDKSVSSAINRQGLDEITPRSNRDLSENNTSHLNSKYSIVQVNNMRAMKEKELIEAKKKLRMQKDIDFAKYVQEPFFLSVTDITLLGNLQGFIFKFEQAYSKANPSGMSNISASNNNKPRKIDLSNNNPMQQNFNLNFNFNQNTRNLTSSMQYSIQIKDSIEPINPSKQGALLNKIREIDSLPKADSIANLNGVVEDKGEINVDRIIHNKDENEKDYYDNNPISEGSREINSPERRKKQANPPKDIPMEINFVKNPTFSDNANCLKANNIKNMVIEEKEVVIDGKNYNIEDINPFLVKNKQPEEDNFYTDNEDDKIIKKEKAEKSLGATNWIRNIRKERMARKKQMREMRDLKIDKNYLPEITSEFYLDPLDGTYKINAKNPANFVEIAKIIAEKKINWEEENANSENDSEDKSSSGSRSRSYSYSGSRSYSSSDSPKNSLKSAEKEKEENEKKYYIEKTEANISKISLKESNIDVFNNINIVTAEKVNKLGRASKLNDVNLSRSMDFENGKKSDDEEFDVKEYNYNMNNFNAYKKYNLNPGETFEIGKNNSFNVNTIKNSDFKINLQTVKTKVFDNNPNINIEKNNENNNSLIIKKVSSVNSGEDSSYRSDGSKNPDANNKRNMMFINGSQNKSNDQVSVKESITLTKRSNDIAKKNEQPKVDIIKKSKQNN